MNKNDYNDNICKINNSKEYESLYYKSKIKYNSSVIFLNYIDIEKKNDSIDEFFNHLIFKTKEINTGCEYIIKAICNLLDLNFDNSKSIYDNYDLLLSKYIHLNTFKRFIFQSLNEYINLLKDENNTDNNKNSYIFSISNFKTMIEIYEKFEYYYTIISSKKNKYLEKACKYIAKLKYLDLNYFDSLNVENREIYFNNIKIIIDNLLNFICDVNKIESFDKLSYRIKSLYVFKNCNNSIFDFQDIINYSYRDDDLEEYINYIGFKSLKEEAEDFYKYCEDLKFK